MSIRAVPTSGSASADVKKEQISTFFTAGIADGITSTAGVDMRLFCEDPDVAVGVGVDPMLTGEFVEQAWMNNVVKMITDIKRLERTCFCMDTSTSLGVDR